MDLPFPPMEPVLRESAFDDPAWTFEVKWDGVRCVALVETGRVRLWSRRLRERTQGFPELQALPDWVAAPRVVLDGELVVLRGGRPSFPGILERDLVATAAEAVRRAEREPATYVVFDLLEAGDQALYGRPLAERQDRLREVLRPGGPATAIEGFPGTGRALFAAVAAQELEGIVAKRLDSSYRFGPDKSPLWAKVKRRQEMLCVAGGYTVTAGRVGALLLGARDAAGRLRYLGRAGSGLTEAQLADVAAHLAPAPCPFDPVPAIRAERFARQPDRVVWVAPALVVRVSFQEWTGDGRLRSPVVQGFVAHNPDDVRQEGVVP